jgi:hypothetical protein
MPLPIRMMGSNIMFLTAIDYDQNLREAKNRLDADDLFMPKLKRFAEARRNE